jgi:DnaJ-class molecular chaperone
LSLPAFISLSEAVLQILEVRVEKGMKHNQKIKFSGEADEAPGTTPGDVVFQVQVTINASLRIRRVQKVQISSGAGARRVQAQGCRPYY